MHQRNAPAECRIILPTAIAMTATNTWYGSRTVWSWSAGRDHEDGLEEQVSAASKGLGTFGRVPLVHTHEWNLTPTGPLSLRLSR
jgi:hypothetical protein